MKIDNSFKPAAAGAPPATPARPSAARTGGSAEVRLSDAATRMAATESSATFDVSRVAEIKKAIAEGRFSINADAIADSLLATAREMIVARQNG